MQQDAESTICCRFLQLLRVNRWITLLFYYLFFKFDTFYF